MDIGSCADSHVLQRLQRLVDACRADTLRCEALIKNWNLQQETAESVQRQTTAAAKKWFLVWRDEYQQLGVSVPTEHKPCARDVVWACLLRCLFCANLPRVDSRYHMPQHEAFPQLLEQDCVVHQCAIADCTVHDMMLSLNALVNAWCTNKFCDQEHEMYVNCLLKRVSELSCFVFSADVADDDRFTSVVQTSGIVSAHAHFACNTHFMRETSGVLHSLVRKCAARAGMILSDQWQALARGVPTVRRNLHAYLRKCYSKDIMAQTEKIVIAANVCIGERDRLRFARPLVVSDDNTTVRHFRPDKATEIANMMDNLTLQTEESTEPTDEPSEEPTEQMARGVLAQQVVHYVMQQNSLKGMGAYVDYDLDDHDSAFRRVHDNDSGKDPHIVRDCGCLRLRVGRTLSTQTDMDAVCLWVLHVLVNQRGNLEDGSNLEPALRFLSTEDGHWQQPVSSSINSTSFALPS